MMFRAMLDHPDIDRRDLSSLRRAMYAMATMPEAQLRRCLERFGCDFYLLFGQTEMSPTSTLFRPEHQLSHAGAVGTPVVNVQAAIMDEQGNLLPAGEDGEIVYRGPHTLTGYLDNEEATDAAFEHGWFHSGDIGHFDADGILWFTDRRKDVIKTGGENVASIEVEKAIYAADENVAEAVVIGLPHERWTEAITAIVVPAPGTRVDEGELLRRVKQQLAGFKVPEGDRRRRRAAQDFHRQDPEERAARPLCPLLRPAAAMQLGCTPRTAGSEAVRARTSPHSSQFGPYTILDLHELPEDGKGFELEDGWLIEVAASSRHNWALRTLARIIERAPADAGSQVVVCDGGEWEISTPAGVRKPDVFVVPRETVRAAIIEESPKLIPGAELHMVAEVISPGSGSERTDRLRKVSEYASWIVEHIPQVSPLTAH